MLDADFRVRLQRSPVIAILRGLPAQHLLPTVEALALGGVQLLEIALTAPGDTQLIAEAVQAFPELLIGAGTVISAELTVRGRGQRRGVPAEPTRD